ncbi:class I SAM-dependent methyltransferase [Rhodomicrobium sp. Az07]|uniref:class I SAM-dependent methyltransferase n=1 Tax=Rhodomicrobium sp. Az07 TaxID=2839034 RepID=UPI002036D1A7|nr:class I SAM-dependent methyltransferase [Rhodomicrobium sp. Az07]
MPGCRVFINRPNYDLKQICAGKSVIDIGCGYGRNRAIVEAGGGTWVGVEPFDGGAHTVVGRAESLPFADASFDIAIMDAVLEHVEDVGAAFAEIARILKPGGLFVGYAAFMECFHEISYSHLSHMPLRHYAEKNGLELVSIAGGRRFGIDYHLQVLLYPIPFGFARVAIASAIRGVFRLKSVGAYCALRLKRRMGHREAAEKARAYYGLECLRQSVGLNYVIQKRGAADLCEADKPSVAAPGKMAPLAA